MLRHFYGFMCSPYWATYQKQLQEEEAGLAVYPTCPRRLCRNCAVLVGLEDRVGEEHWLRRNRFGVAAPVALQTGGCCGQLGMQATTMRLA